MWGLHCILAHDRIVHLNVFAQISNVDSDKIAEEIGCLLERQDVKQNFFLHSVGTNIEDKLFPWHL